MNSFNLTAWALTHRAFTGLLMGLVIAGGCVAYFLIGQGEDPEFTFRVMVVKTLYPGATAVEVEQQVTDRLEQKLQDLPHLDYLRSYSKPGESVIFVSAREDTPALEIPNVWYQVRKKVGDIAAQLPPGTFGPFFNDEFGDTYSAIYALSGESYSYADLKDFAESIRQRLLRVQDVEKIALIGAQDEKIFVEFSDKKLAALGFSAAQVGEALRQQNTLLPAGRIEEPSRNLPIRISGALQSVDDISNLPVRINSVTFRLADIATVRRGFTEPTDYKMRVNGKDALGLGVTMAEAGDVLAMGKALREEVAKLKAELPVGIDIEQVADQPKVVERAIGEFLKTFLEALGTVLLVSFLSLGWRAGSVVALTVPLVLAGTLLVMLLLGISLHRISLGALILALGLLVDDAMIAIEMMVRKIDEGWDRFRAATYAYGATAFPMLTGTLITIAGFLPVGLARSSAGEYTVAIFQVVGISLVLSWVGAVIFTPYLGSILLATPAGGASREERFDSRFYRNLRTWVRGCIEHRYTVIAATFALLGLGIAAMTQVPQQFFPLSNRPELIVDLWSPEGSSFAATEAAARDLESLLAKDQDVLQYASYLGGGSPRFFLLFSEQLKHTNLSQTVVLTPDTAARERVMQRLREAFRTGFPNLRGRVNRLDVGPPLEYPVVFRVLGEDPAIVRRIADRVTAVVAANPHTLDVNDDWNERLPTLHLKLDQDKARALGVSSLSLAQALQAHYVGVPVGQFREDNELIDIVWRAQQTDRRDAESLADVTIRTATGQDIPLPQLGRFETVFEDGVRWRRNRYAAISVRADIVDGVQAPDVASEILPKLSKVESALPPGYFIETGAAKEDAWNAQKSIFVWIPLVVVATFVLLMLQLQDLAKSFLVFLTAPLGIIGAAFALLLFGAPFGFVALLGILALAGMIMRNSVILVDQIQQDEQTGLSTYDAIVESSVRRFRPILLTASAAILAMIPLTRNDFFGPQAITIMGGLIVATALTVFFMPALYAAWFRIQRNGRPATPENPATEADLTELGGSR